MNITQLVLSMAAASANAIALSQTPTGAINLTLNGALVSGGIAVLDIPRRVAITSSGNASNVSFTILGTDRFGNVQMSTITGPNNATVYTNQDFATVTQISQSGTPGAAITAGTNGVASTRWYPGDWRHGGPIVITVSLSTGASLTYTVEFTPTDISGADLYPNVAAVLSNLQNPIVFPSSDATVVAASANQVTNFINQMPGMRLTFNSYSSGTATMTLIPTNTKVS